MGRWQGSDQVAIVGVGTTPFGALYADHEANRSAYDLGSEAFFMALEDSGLERDDIDGLLVSRIPSYQRLADMLGIRRPRLCNRLDGSGRMSAVALQEATAAILSGQADVVALIYGNNGRSAGATYGGGEPASPTGHYDAAYGMTSPGAYCALMYERYKHDYKVPDDALAAIAINNRRNAALNPLAVMKSELTVDQYMDSRFIAEPLRLFDYCLINDGGVCLIVTSVERAKRLKKPVITISGTAARGDLGNYYSSTDFYYESSRQVAKEVHEQAGTSVADVKSVQIYDNFTPTVLFSLEGSGFCERGTAWDWVADGRIALDGELPTNTSGGHTSESYMQGWALHVEAVRQLRGEAGDRQVADCDLVQYMCASPIVSSHLLRRQ